MRRVVSVRFPTLPTDRLGQPERGATLNDVVWLQIIPRQLHHELDLIGDMITHRISNDGKYRSVRIRCGIFNRMLMATYQSVVKAEYLLLKPLCVRIRNDWLVMPGERSCQWSMQLVSWHLLKTGMLG